MDRIALEVSAGSLNTLNVPPEMRDYINERGEGRSFNLDSFIVRKTIELHQVIIELLIAQKGAEQLEPFQVTLAVRQPAAKRVQDALAAVLAKDASE
jgi:hypothetical protein